MGSITHAVDNSGLIKNEYSYDAFGIRTSLTTMPSVSYGHYGYTGQEYDGETGLLYLRARYYDPTIGRFISADPFWGRLDQPASQSRYAYVHNSPLIYTDPTGHDTLQFNACTGGGVGLDGSFCTSYGIQYARIDTFPYFTIQDTFSYDTVGAGATSGASFANTVGIQWTNASKWQQHLGAGNETGGSSAIAGLLVVEGNFVTGQDFVGWNANFGIGLGTPEVHSRAIYTRDAGAAPLKECLTCPCR